MTMEIGNGNMPICASSNSLEILDIFGISPLKKGHPSPLATPQHQQQDIQSPSLSKTNL
jgi:hypothetical protein